MKDIITWKPRISVTSDVRSTIRSRPARVSALQLEHSGGFLPPLQRKGGEGRVRERGEWGGWPPWVTCVTSESERSAGPFPLSRPSVAAPRGPGRRRAPDVASPRTPDEPGAVTRPVTAGTHTATSVRAAARGILTRARGAKSPALARRSVARLGERAARGRLVVRGAPSARTAPRRRGPGAGPRGLRTAAPAGLFDHESEQTRRQSVAGRGERTALGNRSPEPRAGTLARKERGRETLAVASRPRAPVRGAESR